MPTRAQVCAWIAAIGLVAPSVAAGQGRTESEIVEQIVRDGPQAQAIRSESEVTRREQAARLAYPNPSVMYSREGAGFTEFFQAEQSLSLFGARDALSRAGVAATAAAEAERDRRLWLLRSDAATAVARVVAEQQRLDSLRVHRQEVDRLIEILRTREREGEGSRFDRLRAEQELRDTSQLVTSAAVALAEARAIVSGMLPRDASLTTVAVTDITPHSPLDLATLFTRAKSGRAELRALEQLGQRATFEADAARRARLPSPNLFGGVKRADDLSGRTTGGLFGLSVALPVFDDGGRESARWQAERSRLEAERMFIEHRIRSEITGAAEVLTLRHAALSQGPQESADELVQIAVVAYREGEVGILELLDAARTASRARTRSIDLRLDARLAQIAPGTRSGRHVVALKSLFSTLLIAIVAAGCNRSPAPEAAPEEPEASSVTRWTEKTELFAEYLPLAVGSTSRFAIHLTQLSDFKALTEGNVEVRLEGGAAPPEVFRVEAPSRPGIFGVDVKPAHAGRRQLVIALRTTGLNDEHRVGEVEVHPNVEAGRAAAAAEGEEAPGISFLKEQQWSLDFGTALVKEQAVRESIRVPARLEARPGGAADVVAPIDGRLTRVVEVALGASVSRGQELARLLPPPSAPADLPQLERARSEAQTALALATRDRERAERLTTAGAAPARRLDEARSAEAQATARFKAAEASLAQHNAARTGSAADADASFIVRAPVSGVIAQRNAATGANVTAGGVLFRVVDAAQVHVIGQVPEAQAARARLAQAAEIEIAGQAGRLPAGRLVSVGKVLDPQSRTLPITFAFDNRTIGLPVGQAAFLHLLLDTTPPRPVVPAAAVVDDAGRPIVFVQREGETFERRAVTLGPRAGDVVQITEGLKPGERVVTKGAYLVRLASLSTSVPAHGHVH